MEILGIGPLELLFILLIALIVLGPKDMVKAGKTMGRFLRSVVTSPTWRAVTQTSHELRRLPNRLIREAGLEEEMKKLEETKRQASLNLTDDQEQWQRDISPWTTPPEDPSVQASNTGDLVQIATPDQPGLPESIDETGLEMPSPEESFTSENSPGDQS